MTTVVTVYTMPDCPSCEELARFWENRGAEFPGVSLNFVSLLHEPQAAARFQVLAAPAIVQGHRLLHQGEISVRRFKVLLSKLVNADQPRDAETRSGSQESRQRQQAESCTP